MSDLDISHGGAIAVDPDVLRTVAHDLSRLAQKIADATSSMRTAYRTIINTPGFTAWVDTVALWQSSERAGALVAECHVTVERTLLMADVYELVDLRAQRAALSIQGAANAANAEALTAKIAALEASHEGLSDAADQLFKQWQTGYDKGLHDQYDFSHVFGPAGVLPMIAMNSAFKALGSVMGVTRSGTKLSGATDPISATPVKTASPAVPPNNLAESLRRIPSTGDAQLKVERYTMPDGTKRYILYARGTQSWDYGKQNPFDMKSNHELYTRQQAASYQATLEALKMAGAQPGDRVDVYAYSQSAMIAAPLAMESEFDVRVQVTAGSPVEPTIKEDQLLIQLRHTDDPVSALAGPGSPNGTGAPESFVARREALPGKHFGDFGFDAHEFERYIETAEMVDQSNDPRLGAAEESWRELEDAVEIESTEFRVDRTDWEDE